MKLLFLHGAPASGKLTIARHLARITGARLTDNHATIDLARTLFDFDDPGFWELVTALRHAMLHAAAASDLPLLITTACYAHPTDLPLLEAWEQILHSEGATLLPVHLTCDQAVLEKRVTNADRVDRGKICSIAGLRRYQERNAFDPVPRGNVFTVDTSTGTPQTKAIAIAARLEIPVLNP